MARLPRKSAASSAARSLGSLGARKGGLSSAAALSPEQRIARAKSAIAARWAATNAGKETSDQKRVLGRLNKNLPTELAISDGQAGRRRRAAIAQLAAAGKLRIESDTGSTIVAILL
jgi:hypothetical protein